MSHKIYICRGHQFYFVEQENLETLFSNLMLFIIVEYSFTSCVVPSKKSKRWPFNNPVKNFTSHISSLIE